MSKKKNIIDTPRVRRIQANYLKGLDKLFVGFDVAVTKQIVESEKLNKELKGMNAEIFKTNPKLLGEFNMWKDSKLDGLVKNVKPLQKRQIKTAYAYGINEGNKTMLDVIDKEQYNALKPARDALRMKLHKDALEILYIRNFEALKGVTSAMSANMSRVLVDGVTQGKGAVAIARDMSHLVDSIGLRRAKMIARTEIGYAINEAQMNNYKSEGVKKVERILGSNPCDECAALGGEVYDIDKAPELILHPHCTCAYVAIVS